jgi:nicotinamide riboside kinase
MQKMSLKIILTGPESSGKTTLAKLLADTLDTNLVPEFSRPYLEFLGRTYHYDDLHTILNGQSSWELWHARHCRKQVMVCDTDWTVIRIWEQFRYGTVLFTQNQVIEPNAHYFLCAPDMPWQPDPLRENPDERALLFEMYLHLLTTLQANFTILHGNELQRLEVALDIIQKLY